MAILRGTGLSSKIISLSLSIAAVMALLYVFLMPEYFNRMFEDRRLKTRHLVETASSLIEFYAGLEKAGELNRPRAQELAKESIKALRYDEKEYFWINDFGPTMIMHPYKPDLDGKDLSTLKDPHDKALFVEMAKVCKQAGQGFVDYMWPKPGQEKPAPKVSFVKSIPEWDWIVGSGIYVDDVEADINQMLWLVIIVVGGVLLLTILGSFLLARSIANPISRAVFELNAGSNQVADASGQVALASQSLAEGTSELAASLEETSATLEELTTMTGKNAESATEADSLMREVGDMTEAAGKSMEEMRGSMEEISTAGQEISKIIKSIDEIAFQTNLLALNAAVEAARAGEAGAGFAVVADEVRSLAMRAAEAAKNTSTLIEGTIDKINQGGQIVGQVDQAFSEVIDRARRVGILVGEISSGSQEQSEGISQINKAVQDMDNVTQQTAANSEQSAAASEEMSAQAEEIRGVVSSLAQVVGGDKSTDMMKSYSSPPAEQMKRLPPGPKRETLKRPPMPDDELAADDFSDF